EGPQHLSASRVEPLDVKVARAKRGHHGHPPAGSGDRDVEASLTALVVEGSEAVEDPAVRGLAVADGEDDRVALIALDSLEVLDEEPLGALVVEERADVGFGGDPRAD